MTDDASPAAQTPLFELAPDTPSDPPAPAPAHRLAAVHNKRNIPLKGSLDYFPTPPWATLALMEKLAIPKGSPLTCCEPAAGGGHMSDVLADFFAVVDSSDIVDHEGRGWGG